MYALTHTHTHKYIYIHIYTVTALMGDFTVSARCVERLDCSQAIGLR